MPRAVGVCAPELAVGCSIDGAMRRATAVLLAILAVAPIMSQSSDAAFERWAAAHAQRIGGVELTADTSDLRQMSTLVGNALVVALGEPAHGAHEPLAFRNR